MCGELGWGLDIFLGGPKCPPRLHYITLLFRIKFPDYVIILYIIKIGFDLFPRL